MIARSDSSPSVRGSALEKGDAWTGGVRHGPADRTMRSRSEGRRGARHPYAWKTVDRMRCSSICCFWLRQETVIQPPEVRPVAFSP